VYRICADACIAAGAQLAYRALAECADQIADRMEPDAGEDSVAPKRADL
jgi:hypothetical protein